MGLDKLVEDKGGTVEKDKLEIDIERIDRDRGFEIRVDFDIDDEDSDGKYLETYLSPYVEDTPWTREELTNDVVEEAVYNIISEIREEHPNLTFEEATVTEIAAVRKIKPEDNNE